MKFKNILTLLLFSLLLSACTPAESANLEEVRESIFQAEKTNLMNRAVKQTPIDNHPVYGLVGYPTNMNPFYADSDSSKSINEVLYEPLFYLQDENMNREVEPNLLESLEIDEDYQTFTLTIKDNATWHDGNPVTSGDIIYTINYAIENKDTIYKENFLIDGQGVSLEAQGDKTVVITLPRTSMSFLYSLESLTVVPAHLYQEWNQKYISIRDREMLVGNGPYQYINTYYDSLSYTDYFAFEAFENYYGQPPQIPNLDLKVVVHDSSPRFEMLDYRVQAGYLNSNDASVLEQNNYTIYDFAKGDVVSILYKEAGLFGEFPDLKDSFMQALNVDSIKGNFGSTLHVTPANSVFSEDNAYRINDSTFADNNTAQARKDLLKFTLENPDKVIRFGFILDQGQPQERVAVALQENFKDMGVDLELVPLCADEFEAKVRDPENAEFDVCLYSYPSDRNPDNYKYYFFTDSPYNLSGYSNPDLDALWEKADMEKDPVQRKVLYDEIQNMILSEKPLYPLVYLKTILGVDSRFTGQEEAVPSPRGYFRYLEALSIEETEVTQEQLDEYQVTESELNNVENNDEINNRTVPLED